jgi:hypothetical protein
MTKSTEIDQMLTGLVVNNKRVGLNISDLGAQTDMLVKGSDGYEYELNFSKDGTRIYATDDNPDILHDVWAVPSSDKLDGYTTETGGSYFTNMLKINSFFMCSDADMSDAPAATHNYVELSNSLRKDISLNNIILMYLEAGSTEWKYIKLKGTVPAHGTYLIRGAQVGYPSNETVNVDSYDIEWYDGGKLISFDSTKGGTFYLCVHNNGTIYSDSTGTVVNDPSKFPNTISPFNSSGTAPKGYIDCTGAGSISVYGEGNGLTINSGEKLYKCIFHRKYGEDTCSKANKAWAKRKTSTFLTYCNMEKYDSDDFPYWDQRLKQKLVPKASYLQKTFIDDKSALRTDQPNCINQTLGIQGSATATDAKDATRCFTWVSVGYYDEYIEYKLSTDSTWTRLYSIDKKDYNKNDGMHYYGDKDIELYIDEYSRMKWVSVGQRLNVTHRVIIKKLGVGTYDYRVGRDGDNNYISETRQFKVKYVQTTEDSSRDSFDFVQTTDQQGYGFSDYGAWKKSAYAIRKNYDSDLNRLGFLINTGDMSQNGNRENEWVDYYNGKCIGGLQDVPEMTVIGNNDLGSDLFYTLNDDASTNTSKVNSMTIWCWYTFELDPSNPPIFTFKLNSSTSFQESKIGNWVKSYDVANKTITYFVPSLYSFNYGGFHFTALNSEFATNSGVYSLYYNDSAIEQAFKGVTYYSMYCWAAKDIADHSSDPKIVYMHEIPFCISPIIGDKNYSAKEREANNKGMSKLNHDFSDYLDYAVLSRKVNVTSDNTTTTEIKDDLYNKYNSQTPVMFKGGCCFSELFQNYNVKLCLGGHKHTYSLSRPLLENVQYTLSTGSITSCLTDALKSTITARTVYPNSPIMKYGDKYGTFTYDNSAQAFKVDSEGIDSSVEKMSLVTYCMCQATGYKLSSNNDIPGQGVNWLQEYFPCTDAGAINSGQTWSMCNVITCFTADSPKSVELNSYKVIGVTAKDTTSSPAIFDINKQYDIEPSLSTVNGHLGNGSTGSICKVTIEY